MYVLSCGFAVIVFWNSAAQAQPTPITDIWVTTETQTTYFLARGVFPKPQGMSARLGFIGGSVAKPSSSGSFSASLNIGTTIYDPCIHSVTNPNGAALEYRFGQANDGRIYACFVFLPSGVLLGSEYVEVPNRNGPGKERYPLLRIFPVAPQQ